MTTTIKVADDVRDVLKRQAAAADRTLGEHLRHLAELADRELRFDALRAAMAATSDDDWSSYREESEFWDRVESR
ncbi:MAG: hypothetical protein J0G30_04395 [Actinomycetales bacterium]|nr:hypothetical protein [Actinomycetales bacterium]